MGRKLTIILLLLASWDAAIANELAETKSAAAISADAGNGDQPQPAPDATKSGADANGDAFCGSIVDAAREERYFLKQQELKALLASVNERLDRLEKKKSEYEQWVRRREDFASRASKNLLEIYAAMKPESAAARMAVLEKDLAASLLLAITPRQASAILNEMDEKVAASLTTIMAASSRKKDPS
jgi:flagellar motility protein MotE (MotC chaperone)